MNEQITGALFKRMVLHGAAVITAQKQAINDLNVFPVPDGDTGTNMSMTISTAVAAPALVPRSSRVRWVRWRTRLIYSGPSGLVPMAEKAASPAEKASPIPMAARASFSSTVVSAVNLGMAVWTSVSWGWVSRSRRCSPVREAR